MDTAQCISEACSFVNQIFSDEKGVYVKFESKGDANAVDSPATLYFTVRGYTVLLNLTRAAYFIVKDCQSGYEILC